MFEAEPQAVTSVRRPDIPRMVPAAAEIRSRVSADPGRRSGDLQSSVPSSPAGSQGPPGAPGSKPRAMQWNAELRTAGVPIARRDVVADGTARPGPQRQSSRDAPADSLLGRPGPQRQSSSANAQRQSSRDAPADASVTRVRLERPPSRGALETPSTQRQSNGEVPVQAYSAASGFQRQLGRDTPAEAVAPTTNFQWLGRDSPATNAFVAKVVPLQQQSRNTSDDAVADSSQGVLEMDKQPDEVFINAAEGMNGDATLKSNATKQQLQLAMSRVAEQAKQIFELRSEASKMEEFKAESREATRELEQLRLQLSADNSSALETELRRSEELRTLQAEEIEELRLLQDSTAPLSELQQMQEECAQLTAERELIRNHVDKQQSTWDAILQSNRDEVASMLKAFEKEQIQKAALTSELQMATEQARRAEQAQLCTHLEGVQELEAHRTIAAQEKAVNMVEMQAHLQHLADRQAAIDGLSRERMVALQEVSRIEAESAQVAAQTEYAQQQLEDKKLQLEDQKTKKAKTKRTNDIGRHQVASLMQSLEAERAKHTRLAEELKFSLEKVARAEKEHKLTHERREEALAQREANEAEKHAEMQTFILQMAARQQAIDDLSRERTAALEQVFQIEAASARVTARTKAVQRDVEKQQSLMDGDKAQAALAKELHAALEQVQRSQGIGSNVAGQQVDTNDFGRAVAISSGQDEMVSLLKRVEAEQAANDVLAQELRAASERAAQAEREQNLVVQAMQELQSQSDKMAIEKEAHAKQVAEHKAEKDLLNKERAAALDKVFRVEAKCAETVAERDRVQREFDQQKSKTARAIDQAKKVNDVQAIQDQTVFLANDLEAEKAAKEALTRELDAAMEQTFRAERDRDMARSEGERVLQELMDLRRQLAQERETSIAEMKANSKQVEESRLAKEGLRKERSTALAQVSKAEAQCAQTTAERDRLRLELTQEQAKRTDKADFAKDKATSLAKDLEAEQSARKSIVKQLDAAMEQTFQAERDRDAARAERERALQELQAQSSTLKREKTAALDRASQAEAKCAQAAAERDRLKREVTQQQAKTANASDSKRDELASLTKRLEAEQAAKNSLVQQLDAAMEQTFRIEQERDKIQAEREEVRKEYQDHQAKMSQEREANVAEVQAQVTKERAAALQQASQAEARCAQMTAEKDRLKREIADQQTTMTSLAQRLEEQKRLDEQKRKDKEVKDSSAALERAIDSDRDKAALPIEDKRSKSAQGGDARQQEIRGLRNRLEEEKVSREVISKGFSANLQRLESKLYADNSKYLEDSNREQQEARGTQQDTEGRGSSTRSNSGTRLFGDRSAKTAAAAAAAAAAISAAAAADSPIKTNGDRNNQFSSKSTQKVSSKGVGSQRDLQIPSKDAGLEQPARSLESAMQVLSIKSPSSQGASESASKPGSQGGTPSPSKDTNSQGKTFQFALQTLNKSPSGQGLGDVQDDKPSPGKESSQGGRTFQSALQALNKGTSSPSDSQSRSTTQSPTKAALSPSKDSSQGDPQSGRTFQGALQALNNGTGSPSDSQSRSASQPGSKTIVSRTQSPRKDASSQGDSQSGKTFQSVLRALDKVPSQGALQPQGALQDLSKGTDSQGDPQSRSTSQVSTITPGTPPTRRSAEPFSFSRKDLQSAQPPPSSKGAVSQGTSRAPSTGLGSQPQSRAPSQDKTSGGNLRGLAQTRANIQKLHERLNMSASSPKKDEAGSEATADQNRKSGGTPTSPESPTTDTTSPDKRTPEKIVAEASQQREVPPLALEGIRKGTASLTPRGRVIKSGPALATTPSTVSPTPAQEPSARREAAKEQDAGGGRSSSVPNARATASQSSVGLTKSDDTSSRSWLDSAPGCRSLLDSSTPATSSKPATPSTPSSFKARLASVTVQALGPRSEASPVSQVQTLTSMKTGQPASTASAAATATTTAAGSRHTTPRSGLSARPGSSSVPSSMSPPNTTSNLLVPGRVTPGRADSSSPARILSVQPDPTRTTSTPSRSAGVPTAPGKAEAPASMTSQENRPGLPPRLGSAGTAPGGITSNRSSSTSGVYATVSGGNGSTRNRALQPSDPPYAYGSTRVQSQD